MPFVVDMVTSFYDQTLNTVKQDYNKNGFSELT